MLVLTRKIGELVRIGDQITVRVLAVRNRQVSLGFVAPSDVKIYREEVLRLIEGDTAALQNFQTGSWPLQKNLESGPAAFSFHAWPDFDAPSCCSSLSPAFCRCARVTPS